MSIQQLPFDQRACFIGGPAKSGTTLVRALLDGHPQLLALPQDTDYFSTVLTKFGGADRRAQFHYLTNRSYAKILFGGKQREGKHDYSNFPQAKFREIFARTAFDPTNANRDLLALLMQSYAELLGIPLDRIVRWVEKTPANRNYIGAIFEKFPHAKLLTTMRDPRALLSSQIALKRNVPTRHMSIFYVVDHWRANARLALQIWRGDVPGFVVKYEELVRDTAAMMKRVCDYLEIEFDPNVTTRPTKVGELWSGNSAVGEKFSGVNAEQASRWENALTENEIGWIEWHCRDLMPDFGYAPRTSRRSLRHWFTPVRGEGMHEFIKSRAYSVLRSTS